MARFLNVNSRQVESLVLSTRSIPTREKGVWHDSSLIRGNTSPLKNHDEKH
jgi:hypothetical protein